MAIIPPVVRRTLAWSHLWIGLIGGLFICLMGVTGTIVTFRPQIASTLSPKADTASACVNAVDWNQAQQQIESTANSRINRIYFPDGGDSRYRFRMLTDTDAIYTHVIYDGCAGRVLGTAGLQWMDWLVDLHHNLLAGKSGRQVAGVIGLLLFFSGLGGLFLWLLSRPSLKRLFHIQIDAPVRKTMLDLHRSVGVVSASLLLLGSFTGFWLCYPQPMRSALGWFVAVEPDVRAPAAAQAAKGQALAGLQELIASAQQAIPDGRIREIRMPEGYGNVQVRMWRNGDFRSLGNNVVSVDRASARVTALDLYSSKPAGNRLVQAMAGLHYGEWGGITFRSIYGVAGLATVPLFLTGVVFWWLRRRRVQVESPSMSAGVRSRGPIEDRV